MNKEEKLKYYRRKMTERQLRVLKAKLDHVTKLKAKIELQIKNLNKT